MPSTVVSFEEITVSNSPQPPADADGCRWVLTGLDGWFGGLAPIASPVGRPMFDGTYDGPVMLDGRTVEVAGSVEAPDEGALYRALDRIAATFAGWSRRGPLVVQEASTGLTRQSIVRLGGATLVDRVSAVAASFSFNLYASDPLRYSASLRSASASRFTPGGGRPYPLVFPRVYGPGGSTGILEVSNGGNAATWPVIRFTGPVVKPSLRFVGGSTITALVTLNTGEELVIDSADRSVRLGQSDRRQFLAFGSEWFSLPAGNSRLYYSADSGTGKATVQWRDAWS